MNYILEGLYRKFIILFLKEDFRLYTKYVWFMKINLFTIN